MTAARYAEFLRQRYASILAYTALLLLVVSLLILSPLAMLVAYPQEASLAWGFLLPGISLGIPSLFIWRWLRPRNALGLSWQEGSVIVVLAWLLTLLVGALPFVTLSGLDFTQAVFESTSGWTTAGLSLVDVRIESHLLLFYRSVIQLAGGAGLAILMLSALSGPLGPGLSVAEGRSEQLLPHVRRSARLVLGLYSSYVILGILALYLAGMEPFDAVNHAFTALSTGGFSTRADSIAYWDNPVIEAVIIVLMLMGTLNFLTAFTLLQGKLRSVARNGEVRLTAFFLLFFASVLFLGVTHGLYPTLGESLRAAIFNTVSGLSTTGFSIGSYTTWNGLGWLVMVALMLMGGGTGSTAGGIKQYRLYTLIRGFSWEFRRRFLPKDAVTEPDIWQGQERLFLSDQNLRGVTLYVLLYLMVFFVGSGSLAAYGYPLRECLFEFASALSTVGLSAGITAPGAPSGVLWIETCAMVLGRLEFYPVVIGLSKILSDLPAMFLKEPKSAT